MSIFLLCLLGWFLLSALALPLLGRLVATDEEEGVKLEEKKKDPAMGVSVDEGLPW